MFELVKMHKHDIELHFLRMPHTDTTSSYLETEAVCRHCDFHILHNEFEEIFNCKDIPKDLILKAKKHMQNEHKKWMEHKTTYTIKNWDEIFPT